MADEDEIDILGDFTLSNLPSDGRPNILDSTLLVSQNSELLNCDYTIHPQWLLDKPSANPDNWYESTSVSTAPDIQEADGLGHISTEDCITDESGWTEKEKSLLHRGIEIFGKSSVRLSQFVGTKTSSEVKYYLKNYFSENQNLYREDSSSSVGVISESQVVTDVLDSDQIPASIEEVIAVVSTASPTVSPYKKIKNKSSSNSGNSISTSYKETSVLSKKNQMHKNPALLDKNKVLNRFYMSKKLKSLVSFQEQRKPIKVKFRSRTKSESQTIDQLSKKHSVDHKAPQFSTKIEITTGKGLAVPICEGEEIVKIENVEDDLSDISIDIEDTNDSAEYREMSKEKPKVEQKLKEECEQNLPKQNINSDNINEMVSEQLTALEEPTVEATLNEHNPTELEKFVHYEFFEGRSLKTPERYLKIRNHIINNWKCSKPNYINKTSMRLGLKNCGDVTCISRIHYFLEQIGAINFGCVQMKYDRPLCNFLQFSSCQKEKPIKKIKHLSSTREFSELGPRQRFKKKFNNDGEGGYTLTHGTEGQVINTTIVNEEPLKLKTYVKKPPIQLIYCRPFTVDSPQQYVVKLSLSTLILMDFHAHAYLTEVMGLVGGSWDPQTKTLNISVYEPCKNVASSTTHCDMCPISQAKAAESIHNAKLDILGWFHSHPTFAPEPSQQDLDTQKLVQQWIGHKKPCIGVILSPFSSYGALISSPFRCLVVDKKPDVKPCQLVPFRFKVDVLSDTFDIPQLVTNMKRIMCVEDLRDKRLDFNKPYFQDSSITHLEKFIFSVNMHLVKHGSPSHTNDEIIQRIKDLLTYKGTR